LSFFCPHLALKWQFAHANGTICVCLLACPRLLFLKQTPSISFCSAVAFPMECKIGTFLSVAEAMCQCRVNLVKKGQFHDN
jgi:hypothetical protein